jgi:tetratricopeptide (TPR) repeat protein
VGELRDDEIERLCHGVSRYDLETAFKLQEAMKDKERGLLLKLTLAFQTRDSKIKERVLPVADELKTSTRCAGEAAHLKGLILVQLNRHAEAIEAFRRSSKVPENGFLIAQCYAKIGKLDQAVSELVGIENTVPNSAPRAAWIISTLYRDAGKKDMEIRWLRKIVNSYKHAPESSSAHQRLQELGVPITGGEEAGEKK